MAYFGDLILVSAPFIDYITGVGVNSGSTAKAGDINLVNFPFVDFITGAGVATGNTAKAGDLNLYGAPTIDTAGFQHPLIGITTKYSDLVYIGAYALPQATGDTALEVVLNQPPLLTANFIADVTSGDANLTVQFTDLSYGVYVTQWTWSFGDGSLSYAQNPLHIYTKAGTYTVSLIASDGLIDDTLIRSDYIDVNMVAAATAVPSTGNVPLSVQFTDLSVGEPTSWYWVFGDGFTSTSQNPLHTYVTPGTYSVSFTATRGLKSDIISIPVDVGFYLEAAFTSDVTSGKTPLTVQFTDRSTGSPTSWYWDFGDGATSTLQNPSHTYSGVERYSVTLTVFALSESDIAYGAITTFDVTLNKIVVYVDSQNGIDFNDGEIDFPVQTIQRAYDMLVDGGLMVIQNGTGISYGNLAINKNLMVQAAYGATPKVDYFEVTSKDCAFEGLTFENSLVGISVNQIDKGALRIRECTFNNIPTAIDVIRTNYVSVTKNTFKGYDYGIRIQDAQEVIISANVFCDLGARAIEVINVGRIDLWRNTIFGASTSGGTPITPDINLRIIYHTLTTFDISNRRLQLPTFSTANPLLNGTGYSGYDIAVNVVEGPPFQYGVDYVGDGGGSLVSWDGYVLQSQLRAGDILRVMYSEGADPGGGDAVRLFNVVDPNSTVDSNNIGIVGMSDIAIGVFFNTPLKIRYNNFFGSTTPYSAIATPTNTDGNFSDDPLYVDASNDDFRLQAGSPDINTGDPVRWDTIASEILSGSRVSVAPMDRDLDRDNVDRKAADERMFGSFRGDVGAYEYFSGGHTGDYYVTERGFDFGQYGNITDPFWTPDRGFSVTGVDAPVHLQTNLVPCEGFLDGSRYGRYYSKDLELKTRDLVVGQQTRNDVAYIYPTYPTYDTGAIYVDQDGSDISGDGSPANPYRNINKALEGSSSYVMVNPGMYPLFSGIENKRVIGIPQTKTVTLPWSTYQNTKISDWNQYGSPSINLGVISLAGDSGVYSKDVFEDPSSVTHTSLGYTFRCSGNIEIKASVKFDINTGALYMEALNILPIEDRAVIRLTRSGTTLTASFIFRIGGVSYTYNNVIPGSFDFDKRIRISISIKNSRITMLAESSGSFSRTRSMAYTSSYAWYAALASTGSGTKSIYNYSINADSFSSSVVEVQDTVNTRRKIFGIMGSDTV